MSTSETPIPERSSRDAELIELAYEAARASDSWPSWFLALRKSLDGEPAILVVRGFGEARYVSIQTAEPTFETTTPADAFRSRALARQNFAIGYVAGEIVEDWHHLRPHVGETSGLELFVSQGSHLTSADREFLRELLPHLRRALALHFDLETTRSERDVLRGSFDELGLSCVVLDRDANVVHANLSARDALSTGGAGIQFRDGAIRGKTKGDESAFLEALRACAAGRSRDLGSVTLRDGRPIWFRRLSGERVAAFLTAADSPRLLAPDHLERAFHLTPAESRVASALAFGHTVDEIARRLGIAESTVRQHLKKVQAKTGANRQATLVRRLLETVPNVRC